MIVWLNGTHGVGKTTTARLLQPLVRDSHVLDAEKVGVTLMDVSPGLQPAGNFQHWPPWRQLVVETARRVHEYVGGTLIMPMTVLVEAYWREIAGGLVGHRIEVRHVVLHAEPATLRRRIESDPLLPPDFRRAYLKPYETAARAWLHADAAVVDTTDLTPEQTAAAVLAAVSPPDESWPAARSDQPS